MAKLHSRHACEETSLCPQHSSTADECQNCGMIDVPLYRDHCWGCICDCCGRTAEEVKGSMNCMNWCDECENTLAEALEGR